MTMNEGIISRRDLFLYSACKFMRRRRWQLSNGAAAVAKDNFVIVTKKRKSS